MEGSCNGCSDRFRDICPLPSRTDRFLSRFCSMGRSMLEGLAKVHYLAPTMYAPAPESVGSAPEMSDQHEVQADLNRRVEICMLQHMFDTPTDESAPNL